VFAASRSFASKRRRFGHNAPMLKDTFERIVAACREVYVLKPDYRWADRIEL
jgi:hypothetical protein